MFWVTFTYSQHRSAFYSHDLFNLDSTGCSSQERHTYKAMKFTFTWITTWATAAALPDQDLPLLLLCCLLDYPGLGR
jgi:hypothetical protein